MLLATAIGAYVVALNLSMANVAFPAMAVTFDGSNRAALSWVLNAYAIVFAALLVVSGRLADRSGRRRLFRAGMAVFALGSVLGAVAPVLPLLVAARVVQGVGAALLLPSSLGLLLAAVPAWRRSSSVAAWGGIQALAVATWPRWCRAWASPATSC